MFRKVKHFRWPTFGCKHGCSVGYSMNLGPTQSYYATPDFSYATHSQVKLFRWPTFGFKQAFRQYVGHGSQVERLRGNFADFEKTCLEIETF
jgi:hypothetical protein